MPSRLWPHPTPRSAVSSAFAISPASVRGSVHCSFWSSSASRILPSPVRASLAARAGPAAETLYCPLPPQQASLHVDPRQKLFMGGLVTCGSPSTTRFVSTDTVVFTQFDCQRGRVSAAHG